VYILSPSSEVVCGYGGCRAPEAPSRAFFPSFDQGRHGIRGQHRTRIVMNKDHLTRIGPARQEPVDMHISQVPAVLPMG
jgi:hypothetical protein